MIPLPFSRGIFVVGPPLRVPAHLSGEDMDRYRQRLAQLLEDTVAEADSRVQ
ncbi:MAG: hypothetical protein ACMUIL_06040 [bacterium]